MWEGDFLCIFRWTGRHLSMAGSLSAPYHHIQASLQTPSGRRGFSMNHLHWVVLLQTLEVQGTLSSCGLVQLYWSTSCLHSKSFLSWERHCSSWSKQSYFRKNKMRIKWQTVPVRELNLREDLCSQSISLLSGCAVVSHVSIALAGLIFPSASWVYGLYLYKKEKPCMMLRAPCLGACAWTDDEYSHG